MPRAPAKLVPDNDILLGVNIDHVATLRQARGTRYPEPVQAAMLAERSGADSITMHLREDRRHIQERDIQLVSAISQTRINLEMAVTDEMIAFAEQSRPADCCLVPERREELTTEGGLDVVKNETKITKACQRLADAGIRTSLFIDPDTDQIHAAVRTGASVVELHTGDYANCEDEESRQEALIRLVQGIENAHASGLRVHAGHGLHYHNVKAIAAIPHVRELNVGHSVVARALFVGFEEAVREMKRLMCEARRTMTTSR
ncbi:MAG: pyridoxine 5'-phosphate synthase [Pseudomonadota bacterium]